MKILIIGAGAVGFSIAKQLSAEGHDISIVDENPELIRKITERLDVSVIAGSGTSPRILESAGVQEADMVLAVTTSDEVNIVACIIASKYSNGNKIKIARIRNSEFTGEKSIFQHNGFCVDHMINPEQIIVESIIKIIGTPGATLAVDFPIGDVVLRGFYVPEDAPLVGLQFSALQDIEHTDTFFIVYIQRGDEMITPSHDTTILPGDTIFVLISKAGLPYFLPMVNRRADEVEKLIIYKASRIGMLLAEKLEDSPVAVTIIEPEKDKAVNAAASLRNAVVLHGDATEIDVLKDAAVKITDIFIALSENEQANLLTALLAKKKGAKRTIVLTNEPELVHIINQVDVDVVVNPRLVTASYILKHIRRGRIHSIAKLGDSEVEAIELACEEGSEIVKKPLRNIRFPKNSILGAVIRNNAMLLPGGIEAINPGESVVVFTLPDDIERVQALFSGKQ